MSALLEKRWYRLEHDSTNHVSALGSAIQTWANPQSDVFFVSREGHKVFTNRYLLHFYCSWLTEPLDSGSGSDNVGVSLPVSSSSISNLLRLLGSGIVVSGTKEELEDVKATAEVMMISLENCQIGCKKKKKKSNPGRRSQFTVKQSELASTGETARTARCKLCEYRGRDKDKLARHLKTHSKLLNKNPCKICNYSFKNAEVLNRHMTSYHREETVEEKHTIKVEDEDPKKATLQENEDSPEEAPEEEKKVGQFNCDQCERSFMRKTHLSRHLTTHSGVVHQCSECTSSFTRKDKLTAHFRKKHSSAIERGQELETEEITESKTKLIDRRMSDEEICN